MAEPVAPNSTYPLPPAHQFEADVTCGGWGSAIRIDGVEIPEVRQFTIRADVDGSSAVVELASPGRVSGFIDVIQWRGRAWVALDGHGTPIGIYTDHAEATRVAEKLDEPWWRVVECPFIIESSDENGKAAR